MRVEVTITKTIEIGSDSEDICGQVWEAIQADPKAFLRGSTVDVWDSDAVTTPNEESRRIDEARARAATSLGLYFSDEDLALIKRSLHVYGTFANHLGYLAASNLHTRIVTAGE